jgi:hypothetical protein
MSYGGTILIPRSPHGEKFTVKHIKTISLRVVLYGHENWSLTLREEHTLRVSENRVLRRIFGPRREEVVGGWRRLHGKELLNSYASPNNIMVIKSRTVRWTQANRTKMQTMLYSKRFDVSTTMKIQFEIPWDVTPCSVVVG